MKKFKEEKEKPQAPEVKEKKRPREELDELHQVVKEEKSIFYWKSKSRPFKKRGKDYFLSLILIVLFFIFVSTLTREYLLIGVVLSVAFVAYVLSIIEPEIVEHKITKGGLVSGDHPYLWEELKSFWFEIKGDHQILNIETKLRYPARLIVLLDGTSQQGLKNLLEKHLSFRESPQYNILDRWGHKLTRILPLED